MATPTSTYLCVAICLTAALASGTRICSAADKPFTAQVVEKNRPDRWQSAFASWGTLMSAGPPVPRWEEPKGDRRR